MRTRLTVDGVLRIHPVHVDQVPADQVTGAIQAVGAVDSDQFVYDRNIC